MADPDDDVPLDLMPFFAGRTPEERRAWWRAVKVAYAGKANQLADIRSTVATAVRKPPASRVLSA